MHSKSDPGIIDQEKEYMIISLRFPNNSSNFLWIGMCFPRSLFISQQKQISPKGRQLTSFCDVVFLSP